MFSQIKVLVVDDSPFMRKIISDLLETDPALKVVGTARNGEDALKKISELSPDVVTLDVEMPVIDGLVTLEKIMQQKPLPVIMLSSLTQKGAEITIKALQKGAVDFVPKPSGTISLNLAKVKDDLIGKVKIAATVKVQRTPVPGPGKSPPTLFHSTVQTVPRKLILIGTSTGGPKALNEILPKLPKNIPAAVVIVQHMPAGFTRSLAERLDQISEIRVKEAEDRERVVSGTAYIAPGDYHLLVERISPQHSDPVLRLSKDPPVNGHRPSVDVMMQSAARANGWELIGVILTGMGHDGREGIRAIKEKQAKIIAENETTAVVFGMPKAVIEAKLVDRVLPLHAVAPEIIHLVNST
ncbi:MAG: chemotaxis response regulator protein-glutamate methylesterase [Bacillota bacterium]|nr:chemotaxis response regulator protein-glutamate methylesterase [Bacillota bacterium]